VGTITDTKGDEDGEEDGERDGAGSDNYRIPGGTGIMKRSITGLTWDN